MTFVEADALIATHERTPLDSPDLIGWELISHDIAQADRYAHVALAHMIRDCQGIHGKRSVPYRIAFDAEGSLSLWTLPPILHIDQ
jgi:hypothetical protein